MSLLKSINNNISSIIGPEMEIDGNVSVNGDLLIYGTINGDVKSDGDITDTLLVLSLITYIAAPFAGAAVKVILLFSLLPSKSKVNALVIKYPKEIKISLNIYNISGKNVATLINERLKSGSYEVQWDASGFSSGVYFSELISGENRVSQKMILLK